jgi:hypothetical protein
MRHSPQAQLDLAFATARHTHHPLMQVTVQITDAILLVRPVAVLLLMTALLVRQEQALLLPELARVAPALLVTLTHQTVSRVTLLVQHALIRRQTAAPDAMRMRLPLGRPVLARVGLFQTPMRPTALPTFATASVRAVLA